MAKGKMTSPRHPAICPQDPVTRHKGVFCTPGSFHQQVNSQHVNTKGSEAPELSFKKLLHFLLSTHCCSPPRAISGGEGEAKGNKVSKHFIGKQDPILISEAPGLQTV